MGVCCIMLAGLVGLWVGEVEGFSGSVVGGVAAVD